MLGEMEGFPFLREYRAMNDPTPDLATALDALQADYRQLRPRLAETADQLEQGQPPAEDLLAQLAAARQRFLELRETVAQRAAGEQLSTSAAPPDSLSALTELVHQVTEAQRSRMQREQQQQTRSRAVQVLKRVLSIRHRDRADFAPLVQCQARAGRLSEAEGDAAHDEFQRLAEGNHPLCDVLTLLESYRVIDDERWQQLHDRIAETFGRELALAIVRGRLTFPAANPAVTPSPAPPPEPAPVAPPYTEDQDGQQTLVFSKAASPRPGRPTSSVDIEMTVSEEEAPFDGTYRSGPLTARQLTDLLSPTNGVAVLFGAPVAGLDDVEEHLRAACREGRLTTLDGDTDRSAFLRELDELVEHRPDGLILVLVPSYCAWNEDWVKQAQQQVQRQPSKRKFTRVLFVADPPVAWYWVQMNKGVRDRLVAGGVAEFSLHPWSDAAVAAWLEEQGLRPVDLGLRCEVSRVTGNWTALLQQLAARCKGHPESWADELTALEKEMASTRSSWRNGLGVVPQALPVLKALAEVSEPVTAADLAGRLAGRRPPAVVDAVLRWADLLHFVHPAGHHKWALDPVVRQAVMQLSEEWAP